MTIYKKKKIIHVHSDPKFIFLTSDYECNNFENIVYCITNTKNISATNLFSIIYLEKNNEAIDLIVAATNEASLIIFYDLDTFKMKILNLLNNNIKIGWRFFGHELYKYKKINYLSEYTKFILNQKNKNTLTYTLYLIKRNFQYYIIDFFKRKKLDKKIKKIDFFIGMMKEEYMHLKKYFKHLPKFIELPITSFPIDINFNFQKKDNSLIVGNNRNLWNNHFDPLNIIAKSNTIDKYIFYIPFNYGDNDIYSESLLNRFDKIPSFVFLMKFIKLDEYIKYFKFSKAAIFNGYRQMALANIFFCLIYGVKIYLNKKNPTYSWLKAKKFLIYDIDSLSIDLNTDNISLSISEYQHNLNLYFKFSSLNHKNIFCELIDKEIS